MFAESDSFDGAIKLSLSHIADTTRDALAASIFTVEPRNVKVLESLGIEAVSLIRKAAGDRHALGDTDWKDIFLKLREIHRRLTNTDLVQDWWVTVLFHEIYEIEVSIARAQKNSKFLDPRFVRAIKLSIDKLSYEMRSLDSQSQVTVMQMHIHTYIMKPLEKLTSAQGSLQTV